jgi:hypothetical protein
MTKTKKLFPSAAIASLMGLYSRSAGKLHSLDKGQCINVGGIRISSLFKGNSNQLVNSDTQQPTESYADFFMCKTELRKFLGYHSMVCSIAKCEYFTKKRIFLHVLAPVSTFLDFSGTTGVDGTGDSQVTERPHSPLTISQSCPCAQAPFHKGTSIFGDMTVNVHVLTSSMKLS